MEYMNIYVDLPYGFSIVRKYVSIKLYKIALKHFFCEFAIKYSIQCTMHTLTYTYQVK